VFGYPRRRFCGDMPSSGNYIAAALSRLRQQDTTRHRAHGARRRDSLHLRRFRQIGEVVRLLHRHANSRVGGLQHVGRQGRTSGTSAPSDADSLDFCQVLNTNASSISGSDSEDHRPRFGVFANSGCRWSSVLTTRAAHSVDAELHDRFRRYPGRACGASNAVDDCRHPAAQLL